MNLDRYILAFPTFVLMLKSLDKLGNARMTYIVKRKEYIVACVIYKKTLDCGSRIITLVTLNIELRIP